MIGAVAVIGGGIAGIQASLDLADSGYKVYVIEKTPSLGGIMAQLDKTFPTQDCSLCILSPKLVEAGRHPNIELLTYTEALNVTGSAGDFKVTVKKKARYVDMDKCTGCGLCAEKCPSKVLSEYDAGTGKRKAIYIPFPQAMPRAATIDAEHCLYLTKGKCGVCKKVCDAGAIDYEQKDEIVDLEVGAVILACGLGVFDPSVLTQYKSDHPNVVTALQMERLLSASGPTGGHLERPSDGKTPKKIAYIQCIGSRDQHKTNEYCSSVCCMYAAKQSIVALEHDPNLDITIFSIDVRAVSKGFEELYQKAKNELGIRYIISRPPAVYETDGELWVKYEDVEEGVVKRMDLDMIVLSVGLQIAPPVRELLESSGIKLDRFGNVATAEESPVESNIPGVFVCGTLQDPKDIPTSVAQASGAAAMAHAMLTSVRGTIVSEVTYPEERDIGDTPRVGVFVCHCGINIGGVVDVPAVAEYAKTLPNVVFAADNLYMCASDAQEMLKDMIREHDLNRIVVASCTPRTHEPLFQTTCREAGLNPYLFELANIREHCSWVHQKEPERATEKAKQIVRMAVAKASLYEPLYKQEVPLIHNAVVIGGGVAGMTAAIELAEMGFPVTLIEREAELGGLMRRVTKLHYGKDASDVVSELDSKVRSHSNITLHTQSKLASLEGFLGNFKGMIETPEGAIDHEFGVAIIATGGMELKPEGYYEYGKPNIVTQLELEERLKSGLDVKNVVMIQCAGARNDVRKYCSKICCIEAVKNAIRIRQESDANVYVLYKDMRTYGRWEGMYQYARDIGVVFIRRPDDKDPVVTDNKVLVHDMLLGRDIEIDTDLIVLSAPLVAPDDAEETAMMFKVPLDANKFFLEAHVKLRPIDFATEGVFLCGSAHGPKFIDEAIADGAAVASRAGRILASPMLETEAIAMVVDETKCIGCGRCVEVCPYGAPALHDVEVTVEEVTYTTKKSEINPAACKGCGTCATGCPTSAITAQHFTFDSITASIRAFGGISGNGDGTGVITTTKTAGDVTAEATETSVEATSEAA